MPSRANSNSAAERAGTTACATCRRPCPQRLLPPPRGVGRPPGRMDAGAYVLKPFTAAEAKELPLLLDVADAVETLIDHGLLAAQQKYHAR